MLTASPWITTIAPAAVLGTAVGFYGIIRPRARIWGPVVSRSKRRPGDNGPPRVALTFDDGPTPQSTPAVLDALDHAGAKATFFVVGQNVRAHPRLLADTHAAGHLIANHTQTHPRMGLWGLRRYWRRELDACDDAIFDVIGQRPAFFRPPMGLKHWHLLKEVAMGRPDLRHLEPPGPRRQHPPDPTPAHPALHQKPARRRHLPAARRPRTRTVPAPGSTPPTQSPPWSTRSATAGSSRCGWTNCSGNRGICRPSDMPD